MSRHDFEAIFSPGHNKEKSDKKIIKKMIKHTDMNIGYKEAYGINIEDRALTIIKKELVTTKDYETFYVRSLEDEDKHYLIKNKDNRYICKCKCYRINNICQHCIASKVYIDKRDVAIEYYYGDIFTQFRDYVQGIYDHTLIIISTESDTKKKIMFTKDFYVIDSYMDEQYNSTRIEIVIDSVSMSNINIKYFFSALDRVTWEYTETSPYNITKTVHVLIVE